MRTAVSAIQTVEGVPNFWVRVQRARRRFLGLDYDGTLAPFRIERMKARPFPGTMGLLSRVAESTSTRLAVLSGRPMEDLHKLLGSLRIEMAGSHGYEVCDRTGLTKNIKLDLSISEGLEAAYLQAKEYGLDHNIERKVASLAFHSRGVLDYAERIELAKSLWAPFAAKYGLALRDFNGGVELRVTGVDKGTALLEMLRSEPDDCLIVYIGDDDTDEDAFKVVQGRGIGIRVGSYGMRTAASGRLPNCEAVQRFLQTWSQVAGVN